MQRVEGTARIPALPSEVFAYLADLDRVSEWQTGVLGARRTSEGPMQVGATAVMTRELMGQRIDAPLTVTEYAPPQRLSIESEVSGMRVLAILGLAPAEEAATELTFTMEIRGSGMTAFMEPMVASAAAGDIQASLDRLAGRFSAP